MKIGIIGLGRRMGDLVKLLKERESDLEIVGVIDTNPEAAREHLSEEERGKVRFFDSVEALIREGKPDGVTIGTRCDTHTPFAIEVSRTGLPIYLEKPVANSMEQAIALEAAFEKSKSRVVVSFPLRTSLICERARQLIDQGVIGRPEHLQAVNYVAYGDVYFNSWYRDHSVTQGLFLQKATHDFDYLAYLAGAPITRVAAMSSRGRVFRDTSTRTANPDPNSLYYDQIGTPESGMNEDSSSALLEFANGAKGVYTQVFFSARYQRRGATVSGFKGTIEFDWYTGKLLTTHHRAPFTEHTDIDMGDDHFGGDSALAASFLATIRDGAEPIVSIREGIESAYACLAAKQSAESGQFVNVRQLGGC